MPADQPGEHVASKGHAAPEGRVEAGERTGSGERPDAAPNEHAASKGRADAAPEDRSTPKERADAAHEGRAASEERAVPKERAAPKERADAARNRRAILDATRALLDEFGSEAITMDRVAAAAGVGKGTIFHRFGSRAGLLYALVAEPAETLMAAIAEGPPPLGPGAPAGDRLIAFFDAMTVMMAENVELMAAYTGAPMPPHPRTAEFHGTWDRHITTLLAEVRPDLDAEAAGRLLFSSVGSEVARGMVRGGETERLRAAIRALVDSVLTGKSAP